MRHAILLLFMLPSALFIAACGNNAHPAKLGDHPPRADLELFDCGVEPDAPSDEAFEINPLAPQEYEQGLLTWAHCHVDARMRVCNWQLERTAAGEIVCSLPKRAE